MNLSYFATIIYTVIICLALVGVHISMQWRKEPFYKLLSLLLSVLIVHTLTAWLTRQVFPEYDYIDIGAPFGWFYGPMSYYLLMVGSGHSLKKRDIVHLLPLGLILPVFLVLILHKNWREKYMEMYNIMMYSGIGISWLGYTAWAIAYLGIYGKDMIGVVLKVAGWTVMFILAIFILSNIPFLFSSVEKTGSSISNAHLFVFFGIMIFVLQVYLHLIRHFRAEGKKQTISTDQFTVEAKSEQIGIESKIEYKKYIKIIDKFIADKHYLDPSMNIEKFASLARIPKSHISSLFQDYYKTTFSHFINRLRIQYACCELESVNFSASVDELADKCGFRSRASFYRNFNQEMACTPLEYRNRVLTEINS